MRRWARCVQETQGLGLQSFYDVIQRVGEERGLMDPDAEEQVPGSPANTQYRDFYGKLRLAHTRCRRLRPQ